MARINHAKNNSRIQGQRADREERQREATYKDAARHQFQARQTRVQHQVFGLGYVIRSIGSGRGRKLEVEFQAPHGTRTVLASFVTRVSAVTPTVDEMFADAMELLAVVRAKPCSLKRRPQ